VVQDYRATGLTLRQHPLALLRPLLDAEGYGDTGQLTRRPGGSWLRLPGLVLIRQRPGSARGIVFLTVEDEHGTGNLVVYPDIAARDRAALVAGRLLLAEGRIEREVAEAEVPITHLIVRRLVDLSPLLDHLDAAEPEAAGDWAGQALARANEVRRPEPGSRRPTRVRMPGSRDFN
jgi:error-prone DNA polymerase